MKIYGDTTFQASCAVIAQAETSFPTTPTAGRMVFVNKRLFICAEIVSGLPVWIPLTNELNTHMHNQTVASNSWTVTHNLNTTSPLVQIYDDTHKMVIPDEVTIIDNNSVTVGLGVSVVGRAIVMFGDISGGAKTPYAYTHTQTNPNTVWVVKHELGYYPICRVFLNTNEEIQPLSVIHDSIYQTTVTFSAVQTGTVRCV